MIWNHSKSGLFSVKLAYYFATKATQMRGVERNTNSAGVLSPRVWKYVWKFSLPPHINFFAWKAINNGLAVNSRIHSRLHQFSSLCPRCNQEESVDHLLLRCPSGLNVEFGNSAIWIMWSLWLARNSLIFRDEDSDPITVINSAASLHQEFSQDAKISSKDSAGTSARDHGGKVICSTARKFHFVNSPSLVDALAMREAIYLAQFLKLPTVLFEEDAKAIIDAMTNGSMVDLDCEVVVQDCRILVKNNSSYPFSFINRKCNWVAHVVAKKALKEFDFCNNALAQILWLESRLGESEFQYQ
ncbi:uncharacterized protein LOC130014978 [Mercurialis annua]|uniref:uncharacterized protein LOC130014978 n=1 Tax=Mercurialis annua TaxID=3986 RepID=UPI0024AFDAE1|nr:uncharacterized protein LOC130014978 [Mercurialis annua]